MTAESQGPFPGSAAQKNASPKARGNRDWWPNGLDLAILHQHSTRSNPMGEEFKYAKEFKTLDLEAVVKDLRA